MTWRASCARRCAASSPPSPSPSCTGAWVMVSLRDVLASSWRWLASCRGTPGAGRQAGRREVGGASGQGHAARQREKRCAPAGAAACSRRRCVLSSSQRRTFSWRLAPCSSCLACLAAACASRSACCSRASWACGGQEGGGRTGREPPHQGSGRALEICRGTFPAAVCLLLPTFLFPTFWTTCLRLISVPPAVGHVLRYVARQAGAWRAPGRRLDERGGAAAQRARAVGGERAVDAVPLPAVSQDGAAASGAGSMAGRGSARCPSQTSNPNTAAGGSCQGGTTHQKARSSASRSASLSVSASTCGRHGGGACRVRRLQASRAARSCRQLPAPPAGRVIKVKHRGREPGAPCARCWHGQSARCARHVRWAPGSPGPCGAADRRQDGPIK